MSFELRSRNHTPDAPAQCISTYIVHMPLSPLDPWRLFRCHQYQRRTSRTDSYSDCHPMQIPSERRQTRLQIVLGGSFLGVAERSASLEYHVSATLRGACPGQSDLSSTAIANQLDHSRAKCVLPTKARPLVFLTQFASSSGRSFPRVAARKQTSAAIIFDQLIGVNSTGLSDRGTAGHRQFDDRLSWSTPLLTVNIA